MTDGENDACIGKQPSNQRQQDHVERVLVHQSPAWKQARPFSRTIPVVSADVVEGFLRQLTELGRIMDTAIRESNDGSRQKWLLIHAKENGRCLQYLLDQCGA